MSINDGTTGVHHYLSGYLEGISLGWTGIYIYIYILKNEKATSLLKRKRETGNRLIFIFNINYKIRTGHLQRLGPNDWNCN